MPQQKKPQNTENWNYVQEFQLFWTHYFNSPDLKLRLFCSATYSYCDLARPNYLSLFTLSSGAECRTDIPAPHVSVDVWWHGEINLVQIHLPFPIPISAPTSTKETSETLIDQIFTQRNLWKLLYLAVQLDLFVPDTDLIISLMAHEHWSDVCENKKKN